MVIYTICNSLFFRSLLRYSFQIPYFVMTIIYSGATGKTQQSIQDIQGALFIMLCEVIFTTSYTVINVYPSLMPILRRETNEHIYKFSAYYVAEIISNIPTAFMRGFIPLAVTYSFAGFNRGILLYLQLGIMYMCAAITASAYGFLISGLIDTTDPAELAPPIDLIFMILAGIYINLNNFPYLRFVSLFYFSYEGVSTIFWHDVKSIGKING